jgi:hypothetical protein
MTTPRLLCGQSDRLQSEAGVRQEDLAQHLGTPLRFVSGFATCYNGAD